MQLQCLCNHTTLVNKARTTPITDTMHTIFRISFLRGDGLLTSIGMEYCFSWLGIMDDIKDWIERIVEMKWERMCPFLSLLVRWCWVRVYEMSVRVT